jgi:hypothetical protein
MRVARARLLGDLARNRGPATTLAAALLAAVASLGSVFPAGRGAAAVREPPDYASGANAPSRLADTGLYQDASAERVAADVLAYTPQYPLWSDGATKRRWIRLPPGAAIDASDPDAWVFPIGTQIWKEFSFGRRVETRYMERLADGSWRFAVYAWTADGSDARLAPTRGIRRAAESRPGVPYDLPSVYDCRACHEGGPTPVLGFSALQLSPDRDPLAPSAERPRAGDVDLARLLGRGLIRRLPASLVTRPPRIAAPTPRARAALGYLHANCGNCHDARGPLGSLGLSLVQRVAPRAAPPPALATAVGVVSRFRPHDSGGSGTPLRIRPGHPEESVLFTRMASRDPLLQMPPLGTRLADEGALALVSEWIRELPPQRTGSSKRTPAAPHVTPEEP